MGIFDVLRPKPVKKRVRGKAVSAAEREKREELLWLRRKRMADPDIYDRIMQKKLGLDKTDPFSDFLEQWKRISDMGLTPPPREDGIKDFLKEGVAGLLQFFGQLQQAPMGANPGGNLPFQIQPVYAQPPYQQEQIEQSQQPQLAQAEPTQQPQQEASMSIVSRIIISQLKDKDPEQAAQWIKSRPEAGDLVNVLRDTREDQLFLLLDQYAQNSPDLAGLVAWLHTRPQWFIDTIHQLKAISGITSPSGL